MRKLNFPVRNTLLLSAITVLACVVATKPAYSQTKQYDPERKVVTRVEPEYPETLKRLYIGGVVRVEVVVTAAGSVDSMQLLGGSPILGQSAMKAIKQWKFASGSGKSTFVVPLTFDPHQ